MAPVGLHCTDVALRNYLHTLTLRIKLFSLFESSSISSEDRKDQLKKLKTSWSCRLSDYARLDLTSSQERTHISPCVLTHEGRFCNC